MLILGLNAFHADSAAAIVRDGRLIAAAEEERFRRLKHWAGFPSEAIAYCLREAGANLSDLDHVAFNQDSRAQLLRKLCYVIKRPNINLVLGRLRNRRARAGIPALLQQAFPGHTLRATSHPIEHHLAHLSSAFHVVPSRKRSSSRSMASAISPARPGASEATARSPSMAGSIFRIRSASSIRRSRSISAFRTMATNTR